MSKSIATDNSDNLSNSTLYNVTSGAILADEVDNSTKKNSENITLANSSGNTITQYSEEVADTVNSAIDTLGSLATSALQGITGQTIGDSSIAEVSSGATTTLSTKKMLLYGGGAVVLVYVFIKMGKK